MAAVELGKERLHVGDDLLVCRFAYQESLVVQSAHQPVVEKPANCRTCNLSVKSGSGDQLLFSKQGFPFQALKHDFIGAPLCQSLQPGDRCGVVTSIAPAWMWVEHFAAPQGEAGRWLAQYEAVTGGDENRAIEAQLQPSLAAGRQFFSSKKT